MSFYVPFRRHGQLIFALLRQEAVSRQQNPMDALLTLLEPVFYASVIVLLRELTDNGKAAPLGGSILLFFATGFIPSFLMIYICRRMGLAVAKPVHRFPVEQRLDHIVMHIMLRTIDYLVLALVVFTVLYFFVTPEAFPHNISYIVLAVTAILFLGFGYGVLNMVLHHHFWLWDYIFPLLARVMMVFSGAFYVPDFLPPNARYILSFNPELHIVALFRLAFYPQYPALVLDTDYLVYCVIFAATMGLVLERFTRRVEHQ